MTCKSINVVLRVMEEVLFLPLVLYVEVGVLLILFMAWDSIDCLHLFILVVLNVMVMVISIQRNVIFVMVKVI